MVLCVREDGVHILFADLLKATDSPLAHVRSTAAMLIGTNSQTQVEKSCFLFSHIFSQQKAHIALRVKLISMHMLEAF